MSDKFEKLSIYNVTTVLKDDEGIEHEFTFKPLPFETYPDVYDLFGKLSELNVDGKEDADIIKHLDKELMKDLLTVEKVMIKNSYPELEDEKINSFVVGNVFLLIDTLAKLTFKGEKSTPRQIKKAVNNE